MKKYFGMVLLAISGNLLITNVAELVRQINA